MADNKGKVVKAGLGYTIGNYLLKGLSFFTIPIFARLMSTADYGIFNTYASYEGIFYVIVGLTLHSSFKNAKYKYKDQFNSYISTCVAIGLISLATWLVLGNLFAPLFERYAGFSRIIVNLLLLNSFGTAVIQYYNTYIGIDYRYKDFIKIAALNAISSIGVSILLMVTLMKDDRANARIIGMATPVIVITIFLIRGLFCKAKPTWNREYRSFALSYSLPIIPHGLAQVVLAQFDRIMIRSMVGASEAGIYSFGYNIYSLVTITATSLENVWSPWFYEKMNAGEEETIRKQGNKYAFGMLLFSVSVIFFAPEAISILGTADYHDAVYIVIPVVIAGFFAFLYTLPIQVEYYYGKTKSIAAATLGAALMNIILNYIFIKKNGYIAAAYTTLVTYVLYFGFHYVSAYVIAKKSLFDTKRILLYGGLVIMAGVVALLLLSIFIARWAIGGVIALFTLYWFNKEFGIALKIKRFLGR